MARSGAAGAASPRRVRWYSVSRAAGILGLGTGNVVRVGLDRRRRMDVHQLGKTLLLGLELLVAGDVVRTVALEPTLNNVAVLGLLVVIRTFLSWSLAVEIEGTGPVDPSINFWRARPPGLID